MPKIKRPLIVAKLPLGVAALIMFLRYVIQSMMDNVAWFPNPTPPLSKVGANLDALAAAEVTLQNRAKGAREVRDQALLVVLGDAAQLKAYAQSIIDANAPDAALIAKAAGLSLRQREAPCKPELQANKVIGSPGDVLIRARAAKARAASYEWQVSTDGGETWVTIRHTTVAQCTFSGAELGSTYLFRFRTTVRATTGEWSPVLSYFAH